MLTADGPGGPGPAGEENPLAKVSERALKAELRRRRAAKLTRDVRANPIGTGRGAGGNMAGRYKETGQYLRDLTSLIRAAGRRVGEVDVANLPQLAALGDEAKAVLGQAAWALHGRGVSWTEIGRALGMRPQTAWTKFAPYEPGAAGPKGHARHGDPR